MPANLSQVQVVCNPTFHGMIYAVASTSEAPISGPGYLLSLNIINEADGSSVYGAGYQHATINNQLFQCPDIPNGTYTVRVQDQRGQVAQQRGVVVACNAPPASQLAVSNIVVSQPNYQRANGVVSFNVSGATGGEVKAVMRNLQGVDVAAINFGQFIAQGALEFSFVNPGTMILRVTDKGSGLFTETIIVNDPPACNNQLTNLLVTNPTALYPTGTIAFDLSTSRPPIRVIVLNLATQLAFYNEGGLAPGRQEIEGVPPGNYRVTVQDDGLCEQIVNTSIGGVPSVTTYVPIAVRDAFVTQANPAKTASGTARLVVAAQNLISAMSPGVAVQVHLGDFQRVDMQPVAGQPAYQRDHTYTDLAAGEYTAYIRSILDDGGIVQELEYVFFITDVPVPGCTDRTATNYDPDATEDDGSCEYAPEVIKPYFAVPLMNSLRLVSPVEPNGADILQTLDNVLFCNETRNSERANPGYAQKVCQVDNIVTQFRSNYTQHLVKVVSWFDGSLASSFAPVKKVQNRGLKRQYMGWLAAHTVDNILVLGKTRIYFNKAKLPINFVEDDLIEVLNAGPMSGRYTIESVELDEFEQIPFLVINKAFTGNARLNCNLSSTYDAQLYDVYEFRLPLADLPTDTAYQVILTATDPNPTFADVEFVSEPIALRVSHERTNLITFRNSDNAFDIDFSTGILCGIRVESEFFERQPGGEHKNQRQPNNSLIKTVGRPARKVLFETFELPPYLHEKLAVIFNDCDFLTINGVEYISEENYDVPNYSKKYALAKSSVVLEQVAPFTSLNDAELADPLLEEGGFIIVNTGFLQY